MSRIKAKNTRPEIIIRSELHRLGYRFRIHVKDLPGKPDLVLPKFKTVIFVNGCFWHRHKGCKFAYMPKTRVEFWKDKFSATVKRDAKKAEALRSEGWKVAVVWECQIKENLQGCIREIEEILYGG